MAEQLSVKRFVDAWRTNNRVTMYLIEHLPSDLWSMPVPGAPRKTVRMIAAHLHNGRCWWIKALGRRDSILPPPLVDLRRVSRAALSRALSRSSDDIIRLIELGAARAGAPCLAAPGRTSRPTSSTFSVTSWLTRRIIAAS